MTSEVFKPKLFNNSGINLGFEIIVCCLCYYFVLSLNQKLGVVYQQLLRTANRKQQNTDNVLLLVENCDIKLEINFD